jgi:hypothetical protein
MVGAQIVVVVDNELQEGQSAREASSKVLVEREHNEVIKTDCRKG